MICICTQIYYVSTEILLIAVVSFVHVYQPCLSMKEEWMM